MAEPAVPFDVLDHRAVRRELETEAKTAMESLGLTVSYTEDNIYLFLSFLMVACAVTGQLLPDENLPKLRLMFKMKRLDPKFRLVLASKEKRFTSDEVSVTQFVHEDGYVAKKAFHKWVKEQVFLYKITKLKSS